MPVRAEAQNAERQPDRRANESAQLTLVIFYGAFQRQLCPDSQNALGRQRQGFEQGPRAAEIAGVRGHRHIPLIRVQHFEPRSGIQRTSGQRLIGGERRVAAGEHECRGPAARLFDFPREALGQRIVQGNTRFEGANLKFRFHQRPLGCSMT